MYRSFTAAALASALFALPILADEDCALDFKMKNIGGKTVDLGD